jgi:hypothetical protein
MTASAAGVNVQTDPALYYPRLGWMDLVARTPGRMCGVDTLPFNLNLAHRLPDIRGYDAADPLPIVELIVLAQDPHSTPILSLPYAVTAFLSVDPRSPGPVANLLGVRHLVGRGPPPDGLPVWWAGDDYWVVENLSALPRATVPGRVEVVPDKAERLRRLSAPGHDPAAVTLLGVPTPGAQAGEGSVRIAVDEPGRVVLVADLSRGGIVRLADAWDGGWRAVVNGVPAEVLRVDHALRGVVAPAGRSVIEFRYEPASFRWGLVLSGVAGCATLAVCSLGYLRTGRARSTALLPTRLRNGA